MRRAFVRAVDTIAVGCAVLAATLLAAAMLVVVWMVIYRATGHSTYWEIEAAIYLIAAAVLIGSPYCLKTKGHIGVEFLAHYLPPGGRAVLEVALAVLGLVVCLYLAWRGFELTHDAWMKNETSGSAWNPPRWPFFATMPLGLGLTALQYVAELLRQAEPPAATGSCSGQGARA